MSDLHKTHLYLANAIVCDLSDERMSYPNVQDVKNNWRFSYQELFDVTDSEISEIIEKVKRMDRYTGD